jgi:hypothetical protein
VIKALAGHRHRPPGSRNHAGHDQGDPERPREPYFSLPGTGERWQAEHEDYYQAARLLAECIGFDLRDG